MCYATAVEIGHCFYDAARDAAGKIGVETVVSGVLCKPRHPRSQYLQYNTEMLPIRTLVKE